MKATVIEFATNMLGAGDFGTFIVHTVAEVKDAAIKEPPSVGNESIADKDVASSSHVLGDKAALWYNPQPPPPPSLSLSFVCF